MAGSWKAGDYALCVNNAAKADWAEYFMDEAYSEDMLEVGKTYIVQNVVSNEHGTGLDVGIPTPWGDEQWDAARFRKTLLAPVTRWDKKLVRA